MSKISANNGKDVKHTIDNENDFTEYNFGGGDFKVCNRSSTFGSTVTAVEPKMNNRYLLSINNKSKNKIQHWSIKKTHRPKLINGSWGDITIEFYDVIGPSTSQAIMDLVRYEWQEERRSLPLINYTLDMLDPTGVTVEKWDISGCIKEIDFGELDYHSKDIATIKIIIEPTKVILVY